MSDINPKKQSLTCDCGNNKRFNSEMCHICRSRQTRIARGKIYNARHQARKKAAKEASMALGNTCIRCQRPVPMESSLCGDCQRLEALRVERSFEEVAAMYNKMNPDDPIDATTARCTHHRVMERLRYAMEAVDQDNPLSELMNCLKEHYVA